MRLIGPATPPTATRSPLPVPGEVIACGILTGFRRPAPTGRWQNEPVSVGSLPLKGGGQEGVGASGNVPRIQGDRTPCRDESISSLVGLARKAGGPRQFGEQGDGGTDPLLSSPFQGE